MKKNEGTEEYQKYRWFFTRSGKLVIGGKSAEQNETLVKEMIKSGREYIVMHTSQPGSPFTFLLDINLDECDLEEQAIFTACFSQEWKKGKQQAEIDIFNIKQITKKRGMKKGTFGVLGKVIKRKVKLKLWLEIQEGKLRAVPKTDKETISITPGKKAKARVSEQIITLFKQKYDAEVKLHEVLQAIPSGNSEVVIK